VPEKPEITVYVEAIEARVLDRPLAGVRLASPFLLRSVDPPLSAFVGRRVSAVRRMGKRIVLAFEDDLFLVLHLMIAGRLRWGRPGARIPGRLGLASFDFDPGSLIVTEAGTKRRAWLRAVRGGEELARLDPGGLELEGADLASFRDALGRENHTLRRTLTDPRLVSGIGGAWSDEILHRARLSPVRLARQLDDGEIARLFEACRTVLREWTDRLRAEAAGSFPEKVTAFKEGMAVHGRFGLPCPDCGTAVQRIVHGEQETNYCPRCQTGGKLLADRALSQLLRSDWPRTIDELEERRAEALRSGDPAKRVD
jgi:formamidopyrimidine-DNA glycosylase